MELVYAFFSVNTIAFEILGYPISWLELVGTIFNFVCVVLAARRNIWNWPVGLVGVVLFGILFCQINLYADVFEQVYYLITGITGWYLWSQVGKRDKDTETTVRITTNTQLQNLYWLVGIAATSVFTGWLTSNLHLWAPTFFPEPASLPYLDAAIQLLVGIYVPSFATTVLAGMGASFLGLAIGLIAAQLSALYPYSQITIGMQARTLDAPTPSGIAWFLIWNTILITATIVLSRRALRRKQH